MRVLDAGFYSLVQDYPGRCAKDGKLGEYWRIGIPPSGPADDYSHRLANALVGNVESAATLEVTVHGPRVRFEEATVIAVCGASFHVTVTKVAGEPAVTVPLFSSVDVPAGSELTIGLVDGGGGGQRAYLAVAGGFDVPVYLGSRSTFPLGQMGGHQGRPLIAGDVVPLAGDEKVRARLNQRMTEPAHD